MNEGLKPLISIIIPTRERCETLLYAIRTALDQTSTNFEVIVSDNFSEDETEAVAKSFTDSRVRYFNTGRRLPMSDNWEFALGQARGEYIIFIGDDDAIMPGGIDRLEAMIRARPSLVYCWPTPIYSWPMDGHEPQVLFSPRIEETRVINLRTRARVAIVSGGSLCNRLPGMYHSAVARSIADRIRDTTGRVFHSTQPDVFTCLAVPAFCATAVRMSFCVTVHGVSQKSNGGTQVSKENVRNIERFVREYGDYKLHPTLFPGQPPVPSLVADSILVAMDTFPEFYRAMKFNYSAMWVYLCDSKQIFASGTDTWQAIRKRREIRRYHRFSVSRFLLSLSLLRLLAWRGTLLSNPRRAPSVRRVPDNISDLVKEFAKLYATRCVA